MIVVRTVAALRAAVASLPRPLALVPTMGALHAGHLALVQAGRARAAAVAASIFVNPLQFAASEDLSRYPRDEAGDLAALEAGGCDLVWLPTVEAMYPGGACTAIEVGGPSQGFEGAMRPGHFRGVATVVGKLLHQVGPDLAMFGEKDWQQVQVVQQMAADLDWPTEIVPVPTVRDADGLALSSRNRFLTQSERAVAAAVPRVLHDTATGAHGMGGRTRWRWARRRCRRRAWVWTTWRWWMRARWADPAPGRGGCCARCGWARCGCSTTSPSCIGPMPDRAHPEPSAQSQRALDWLNFFVADVQTGFGPFLAVYLAASGWHQGEIGLVLSAAAIAGMASQVPGGILVDAAPSKPAVMAASLGLVATSGLLLFFFHSFWLVMLAQVTYGATAGLIGPARNAIGLGLVGHGGLSARLGRNNRFNAWGNAGTAGIMGVLSQYVGKRWSFMLAAVLCVPALLALRRIRPGEIDNARARGAQPGDGPPARYTDLLKNRQLLVFGLVLILFQMANASAIPLTAERLGQADMARSSLILAGLVLVPQVVAALLASRVALLADGWGRKPLLLVAFASLTVRILLFTVVPDPLWLLPLQLLNGVEAAVLGLLTPLVVADVVAGSGRYNLAQGAVGIATGLGAAVSVTAVGYVAQWFSYTVGLYALAAAGAAGFAVVLLLLRETRNVPAAVMEAVAATG